MDVKSPEEYRAEAARLRTMAWQMTRENVQRTMLNIADLYEQLARQIEAQMKQKPPSG